MPIVAAVAVAQAVLALIPLATTGTQHLFKFVSEIRGAAQQTNEWPPEAEAAYQARLLEKDSQPQSQPDPTSP